MFDRDFSKAGEMLNQRESRQLRETANQLSADLSKPGFLARFFSNNTETRLQIAFLNALSRNTSAGSRINIVLAALSQTPGLDKFKVFKNSDIKKLVSKLLGAGHPDKLEENIRKYQVERSVQRNQRTLMTFQQPKNVKAINIEELNQEGLSNLDEAQGGTPPSPKSGK